jgi:SAM-dependent methyltransferase
VDIAEGSGVDQVCDVENLVKKFGMKRFDIVIATELLEHVREWKKAISNIKNVCRPNGSILITTRSFGFPYHGYPYDFWRFESSDVQNIFADCHILALERDCSVPGVFVKARKPREFTEVALANYELYSTVANKRAMEIHESDFRSLYFRRLVMKQRLMKFGYKAALACISHGCSLSASSCLKRVVRAMEQSRGNRKSLPEYSLSSETPKKQERTCT